MENSRIELENRIKELELQVKEAGEKIAGLDFAVRTGTEMLRVASENINVALWEYDIADDVMYQTKKLGGIYESDLAPIKHFRQTMLDWGSVYSEDIPVFNSLCDAMENGTPEFTFELRAVSDYNDIIWLHYDGKTIFDANGVPARAIGRTLDVTAEKSDIVTNEKKDGTQEEQYKAFIEEVTAKASERSEKNSALIVYGIDRFDELSAAGGDLAAAEDTLKKLLESQCAVERGSLCAKTGDGRFAVYMRFTDMPRLNSIAARISYRFSDMQLADGISSEKITASAGITVLKNNKDYETAYNEAVAAMQAAMVKGGNGFMHFSPSMIAGNEIVQKDLQKIEKQIEGVLGADRIYRCLNLALTDKKLSKAAVKEAIMFAGEYTDCDSVCLRMLTDDSDTVVWCRNEEGCVPGVAMHCTIEELAKTFEKNRYVIISSERPSDSKYGFDFSGGAVCAAVIAVKYNGRLAGYMAFCSCKRLAWQKSDTAILEAVCGTVSHVASVSEKQAEDKKRMEFFQVVRNDLNIEAFTIIPDTFEVDYSDENIKNSCGMVKGDICYKKLYGAESPCGDCPVNMLAGGKLTAATAHYNESDNRWTEITASEYETEDGKRYAVSRADITKCISNIQTKDVLAGTLSFDSFSVDAMKILAEEDQEFAVVMTGVANFRQLNEANGYEVGDAVIISAAEVLDEAVEKDELFCRVDGARFAMLLRNNGRDNVCTRIERAAEEIQNKVYERCGLRIHIVSGVYSPVDTSIGIMAALDRSILAQKTVRDKAYYTSNMTAVYDEKMNDEMLSKQYIESHMVEALENNEFKVYYQPKVCPVTGRVEGAEALVRWIRPDGEIISPGKFIPLFEKNGFIADMDFAVYRSVITDIRRWQRMGIDIPQISMNVSREHLKDDKFVEKICAAAFRSGVSSSQIELEITESMLNDNMSRLIDVMTALKSTGFKISVDDFGSGYSSLNLIALLPFDTLKIDGGFFLKNELTEKNKAVISSVIELAKKLNLTVVSEGVEMTEQVEFLKTMECDLIQGYYYYKPMPSEEFEVILAEQYG